MLGFVQFVLLLNLPRELFRPANRFNSKTYKKTLRLGPEIWGSQKPNIPFQSISLQAFMFSLLLYADPFFLRRLMSSRQINFKINDNKFHNNTWEPMYPVVFSLFVHT